MIILYTCIVICWSIKLRVGWVCHHYHYHNLDHFLQMMFALVCGFRFCALLKLVSAIFYEFFIFYQMIALQKLWKCFLFHLKSSFLFGDIQIFIFPSSLLLFLPVSHCLRSCSKINLKVYDIINCLNKNL